MGRVHKVITLTDKRGRTGTIPEGKGMRTALAKFLDEFDEGDETTPKKQSRVLGIPPKDHPLWEHFSIFCTEDAQQLDLNDLPGSWFESWEAFYAGAQKGAELCAQSMSKFSDEESEYGKGVPDKDGKGKGGTKEEEGEEEGPSLDDLEEQLEEYEKALKELRKAIRDKRKANQKEEAENPDIGSKNSEILAKKKPDEFDDSDEFPPDRGVRPI